MLAATSATGSVGLGAGGTAGALLAAELAGTEGAAGLPLGLLVLGSAASALLISRRTNRLGRGRSLLLGYLAGFLGAVLSVIAAAAGSLVLLLVGSVLLGGANASVFLTRYAAADVAGPAAEGRALGLVLFSTSIGAVASPLLLSLTGDAAQSAGLPRLSGIYVLAGLAFAGAAGVLWAASSAVTPLRRSQVADMPSWKELARSVLDARARLGLVVLAAANFVMVGVMAVAPVHLMSHGHGLEMTGTVISLHIAGMFAPSPLSGWLADRVGPIAVAALGCTFVLAAGVGGIVMDPGGARAMTLMLVPLGMGWNFAVVGGSAAIARSVTTSLRSSVEGIGEVAMGVAASVAAPLAGVAIAVGGFHTLAVVVAAVAVAVLGLLRPTYQAPVPAPASDGERAA